MLLRFKDLLRKRVLIAGEAGSRKTTLLIRIIEDAMNLGFSDEMTVIDMAPKRVGDIGGRLIDFTESIKKVRLLMPDVVYAPRMMGRRADEVLKLAEENRKKIDALLKEFIEKPSKILFINDITIYLHAGDVKILEDCMDLSETFVGTAYYGQRLHDDKGSGITRRERELTKKIMGKVDTVVFV